MFNVGGTLLFIWFTPYIAEFIQAISPDGNELNVISRQIANAHLCFNIATTIVFIPLIGGLVHVVEKLIPGHDAERDPMDPIYLDYNLLDRPFAAIHMAKKELARMAQISSEMVIETKKAFLGNDLEAADAVLKRELIVNNLRDKITKYLSSILSAESVTEHQAEITVRISLTSR